MARSRARRTEATHETGPRVALGGARSRARTTRQSEDTHDRPRQTTNPPEGTSRRRPPPAAGSARRSNTTTSSSTRPPPSLIFPQIFFPSENPRVAIIASLATYGVGYVARPIGAFVLGHLGDTHGRKNVLILCMFLMGFSTLAVGFLPTYAQVGLLAPALLVILRLIQGFAVAGEISGATSMILEHAPFGRRGFFASFTLQGVQAGQILAAAVFLPLAHFMPDEAFNSWGWRIPFLLSFVVIIAGWIIRREVDETPAFTEEAAHHEVPRSPVVEAIRTSWPDMIRVICMALMNTIPVVTTVFGAAYAVQAAYGIGFHKDVYLWIPVLGNILACARDPLRRQPLATRSAAVRRSSSAPSARACSRFGYLYAISIHNVPLAIVMSLLMWGVVYQGYNAVFPSFYPELFPTRTRVSSMAITQNIGTTITALLPVLFATVAPPGTTNVPMIVGSIAFGDHRDRRRRRLVRPRDLPGPHARPRRSERCAGAQGRV